MARIVAPLNFNAFLEKANTTRENPSSSAGNMRSNSAGPSATTIMLQLNTTSSAGTCSATGNFSSSACA